MNELLGALIILVLNFVAPHAVHGFAGFEWQTAYFGCLIHKSCLVFAGKVALKYLNVFAGIGRHVVIVAHQACGLQAVDKCILFVELPVERCRVGVVIPPAIKPDGAYLAIVGEQLGELGVHKAIIFWPIGFLGVFAALCACASHRIILASPVEMAVI